MLGIRTPPPLVVENVWLVSNRGVDSLIRLAMPNIVDDSTQTSRTQSVLYPSYSSPIRAPLAALGPCRPAGVDEVSLSVLGCPFG